jgi:LmbE family N-acetylglucosaminyl deacetylase
MLVAAHPDDETLGFGGVLARYASEGVETTLLTATRGQAGRFQGLRPDHPDHPGPAELGRRREGELRAAAQALGVGRVTLLDYQDQQLDRADPRDAVARIAAEIRTARPQVVMTFAPDGAYGHPDHIAISQFTTAAIVAAADASFGRGPAHRVSKLYYLAWGERAFAAYQPAFKKLV